MNVQKVSLRTRIRELEDDLHRARLESWSARKGLIAYMDEHGLGERVNEGVRTEIEAGPPKPPKSFARRK